MRKVALKSPKQGGPLRCVLYDSGSEVWVFLRASMQDGPAEDENWFEDRASAEAFCRIQLGILDQDWRPISDPLPGCQHDWTEPVRLKGPPTGEPRRVTFERKVADDTWEDVSPS